MFRQSPESVSAPHPPLYSCYRLDAMPSDSGSSSAALRLAPSGRKGSKKVRTGCVTCKIRKVKCDETKPFCLRCTKTGRKCDGYLDPKALAARRVKKDNTPHDRVLGPLLELAAPEDKRAFYFFQHVTASCISGGFDTVFWKVIVLQISQTEPAVRHAVLAVSSLHEGLATGSIRPFFGGSFPQPTQSFALQQYNKAIARLLDQMHNPVTRPLASLLTCVLFVCIEYMQGKDKESLIHLEQGRQLLTRLDQRSNDPEMECIVRHIVPLYTRLSLTSFLFGGSPVPIPDSLKPHNATPDTFDTLDNMRHSMHEFMEQAFRFTQRARPAKNPSDHIPQDELRLLEVEQDRLKSRLEKLEVAFSLFRASRSTPGPGNALLVLQMYLHAQRIWISTALSSSEVVYDDFLPSFAAIVPLAAEYLELEASTQQGSAFQPQRYTSSADAARYYPPPEPVSVAYATNFNFETHIIPPLYYVATKCRHPLIRRSALELLRRNPFRRENLWRASVMGALAGHIVCLEERWAEGTDSLAAAGSISHQGELSLSESSRDASPGQLSHHIGQPHQPRSDLTLYNTSMQDDQKYATTSSPAVPRSMPSLVFESLEGETSVNAPVDPSMMMMDMEISSSVSNPSSLTASLDDTYSTGSVVEPTMAFLDPLSHGEAWLWQQQNGRRCLQQGSYKSPASSYLSSSMSTSYDHSSALSQPHLLHAEQSSPVAEYSSHSGSSDASSVDDVEEQQRYRIMTRGNTPQPQSQQQAQARATSIPSHLQQRSAASILPQRNLPTEAPFGLPEELRVHDAIIGPEREEGTWVAVFRKLHGFDTDWDIQREWVPAL